MHTSSFAALAMVALIVAFVMLWLTPKERRSAALLETPAQIWSNQR